jgi:hypothetical protein
MTLQEFIDKEQERLKLFLEYWRNMRKTDSTNYPTELMEGDWWEQYTIWEG